MLAELANELVEERQQLVDGQAQLRRDVVLVLAAEPIERQTRDPDSEWEWNLELGSDTDTFGDTRHSAPSFCAEGPMRNCTLAKRRMGQLRKRKM